jgi:WD40 repeat protein
MTSPAFGRVFISYRRQESSGLAGRLYERLAARLGDDQVFMDVDTIAPGLDFAEVIAEAVSTCQVLLAVIGPTWLSASDEDGQRRLEDPDDIVRLEIAAALERNIRVIPILVEGAQMPRRQQLPEDLVTLARRNAISMRHESFRSDADRLVTAIEPILHPPVAPVAVGPETTREVSGGVDPTAIVAEPNTVQVLRHDDDVNGVAFSPNGRLLATTGNDRTARVWEVASGRERAQFIHDNVVYGVAFSPDGRLVATASGDMTARVWEWAGGQERARVTHDDAVRGVAFSPDGRLVATASFDKSARVWDWASGQERARVTHDTILGVVYGVAFSPDGQLLATASPDHTARVWEWAGGHERTWVTHDWGVNAVAFSPDGRLVATASDDGTARVWEWAAGGQERARVTHTEDEEVYGVAFSPDGRLLATASSDMTARVWEWAAGGQERARVTHDDRVRGVAFSPDGRLLATASDDDSARVWALVQIPPA